MSIQAVAWALDQYVPDPVLKLILISLANHADHITGICWPSMRVIGNEASCRRETVLRKLPDLEERGFIEIIKAKRGERRRAHTYRLLIRCERDAHQIATAKSGGSAHPVCAPLTRGCDTALTTMNHHITITSSKPPSPIGARKKLGDERAGARSEHASVVQARVASRLGKGNVAEGWTRFGALSDTKRDELTAQERNGRLSDAVVAEVLLSLSAM
jgi:Helix-turn-helix domain